MDQIHKIISKIANAAILTDIHGNVLSMNSTAKKLIKIIMKKDEIRSIQELEADFLPERVLEREQVTKQIRFNNIKVSVEIFRIRYDCDQFGFLYIFDQTVWTSEILDKRINCIEDMIAIFDANGAFLKANDAMRSVLPANIDFDELIGVDVQYLIDNKIAENPVTPKIIKAKKPMSDNVMYADGTVITYSGSPIYNEDGEMIEIILTGRDVSKLVELENRIREVERINGEYQSQLKELEEYREMNRFVFSSSKMENVLKMAMKAARTDSSIFITGESGVGKEEIATFIHRNSKRKDQPYIAINCAAIPSELLESEFFGYEEGAFTGAKRGGKKGLFEEANGGTIFLDEIGELPLHMQSKLLRVIQENIFMRIGGKTFIPLNVRYICATNLSKEQLASTQKFRQDLYYRLSVIPLRIPSLRERREDVLPLIQHFLMQFNGQYDRNVKISKNILLVLQDYDWPGNVRELKNVIERLVILADANQITDDDLKMVIHLEDENREIHEEENISIQKLIPLNEAYKLVDEILITKALKEHHSIIQAAKALEIDPSTIHRKMKKGYDFK